MNTEITTLGLVEDQTLFRKTLSHFINHFTTCKVIMEAGNGKELQNELAKGGDIPDILLLDLRMPVMDGFETIEWLHKSYPDLPVIILTMHDTTLTMAKLVQLGARAIIKKNISEKELLKAIFRVKEDGYYFNDIASRNLLSALYKDDTKKNGLKILLSEKEWTFLKLAATDLTHKQIASAMKISPRAVNKINCRLFEKLGVSNRVVLAIEAIKHGIIEAVA